MAGWCHETLITLSRKAIMKKLFVCAATAVLLLSLLVGVSTASASDSSSPGVNQKLSAKQIEKRFAEINSSYQLGEPLSDEDAEFVRTYATPAASGGVSPMATQNFNRSGSGYGVSASFYGSVFSNIGLLSCSFGGNVTCTILSGYLQWQGSELHITQTTYGVIGSGGIGIVYNGEIVGPMQHVSPYGMNQSRTYHAILPVYGYTHAYCVIQTQSGSFSISGI
jgi:hypothetical protein